MTVLEIFSIVIYSAVLAFGVFAAVASCVSRKKGGFRDGMWLLTVLPASVCVVLVSIVYIYRMEPLSGLYVGHLSFAMSPLFLRRMSGGRHRGLAFPLVLSVAASVAVVFSVSGVLPWNFDKLVPPLMSVVLVLLIGRILWRKMDVGGKYDAVGVFKEGTDSLVDILYYASLVLIASVGFGMGDGVSWGVAMGAAVCVIFLIGFIIALWLRMRSGRAFLLLLSREETYLGNIDRKSRLGYMDNVECGLSGEALFKSLIEYFDSKLPYLDPKINLTDVSKSLMTNKLYLSRTINDFTGQNFCQFVNLYRVKYAMSLFRSNNAYKVTDLAAKSGFHSERSFTMAFRLYMNIPPSQWCRQNRGKRVVKVLRN